MAVSVRGKPKMPIQVNITRNDETHIEDVQEAAEIVHICFPYAPVPIRIEGVGKEPSDGWLVDLDVIATHEVMARERWFKISTSDPHGFVTLEIPQP